MSYLTWAQGGAAAIAAIRPAYPYPLVPFSSIYKSGETLDKTIQRLTTPSIISEVPAGTFQIDGFSFGVAASNFQAFGLFGTNFRGLIGAGSGKTILQLAPNSGTIAPPTAAGSTNNMSIIRIGTGSSAPSTAWLEGFTLQGSPQDVTTEYNGIMLWYTTDAFVSDVEVLDIPGSGSAPPQETFAFNSTHSTGDMYLNCLADMAGGSAGFGTNYSTGIVRIGCVAKDSTYGAGFTEFECSDLVYADCQSLDNAKAGFNFERATGTVMLANCTTQGNQHELITASDQASAVFTIINPVTDTPGVLRDVISPTYGYPVSNQLPQKQLASDIHLTGATLSVVPS
jgi:hypothetical protein